MADSNIRVPLKYQPSACVSVNGVRADGQAGTPSTSPYNNGNWFPSVGAASAAFANLTGGYPLKDAGNNACVTDCGSGKLWVQNGVGGYCVASSPPVSALCPDGNLVPASGICPVPPVIYCSNDSSQPTAGCFYGELATSGLCTKTGFGGCDINFEMEIRSQILQAGGNSNVYNNVSVLEVESNLASLCPFGSGKYAEFTYTSKDGAVVGACNQDPEPISCYLSNKNSFCYITNWDIKINGVSK